MRVLPVVDNEIKLRLVYLNIVKTILCYVLQKQTIFFYTTILRNQTCIFCDVVIILGILWYRGARHCIRNRSSIPFRKAWCSYYSGNVASVVVVHSHHSQIYLAFLYISLGLLFLSLRCSMYLQLYFHLYNISHLHIIYQFVSEFNIYL